MAHDPKLSVYYLDLKPESDDTPNTNRQLIRSILNIKRKESVEDEVLFVDFFRYFLNTIDTPKMVRNDALKKCMTAFQSNMESDDVQANLLPSVRESIIDGKIEGGPFGRRRKRRSIDDKLNSSEVSPGDAITDDFYFLLYIPLSSNRITLLVQSYSTDSLDTLLKNHFEDLFTIDKIFKRRRFKKYYPPSIIADFKKQTTVSKITYKEKFLGATLSDDAIKIKDRFFNVMVQIVPVDDEFSLDEFDEIVEKLSETRFMHKKLGIFKKKTGNLTDGTTGNRAPFELDNDFDIHPKIDLKKYLTFEDDVINFDLIKTFCITILNELKAELYPQHAVQED